MMNKTKIAGSGNLTNIKDDADFRDLRALFTQLKRKYGISQLIHFLDKKELLIPDCIFTKELSVFQSIVKYLKENCKLKNKDIATLLHKSQESIWQAYNYSKIIPSKFKIVSSEHYIPLSDLDFSLTILESVVVYLKEKWLLNYHKIAILLKRDDRTIWTVYQRAKKKI